MKLKDLLFEVRVYENNFVKISTIENELSQIFAGTDTDPSAEPPRIKFDENGMFLELDNTLVKYFDYYTGTRSFSISDSQQVVDELNNKKKYYVEYLATPTQETPDVGAPEDGSAAEEQQA